MNILLQCNIRKKRCYLFLSLNYIVEAQIKNVPCMQMQIRTTLGLVGLFKYYGYWVQVAKVA